MNDTAEHLRRQIRGTHELRSVVRTMKTLAAGSISQYEAAVRSLADYSRTVQLGLSACLRHRADPSPEARGPGTPDAGTVAVVFGSDQGLVGQFNESLAGFVLGHLKPLPGDKAVWPVGERVHSSLTDAGIPQEPPRPVPVSARAITGLVAEILMALEARRARGELDQVILFHNRPRSDSAYQPLHQRLLPLDTRWRQDVAALPWPTRLQPEVLGGSDGVLPGLVREYLFVSLFQACAESLASENASRLAAMQRAERNIDERLEELARTFHRSRQGSIDEELFDLIAGFEALSGKPERRSGATSRAPAPTGASA